MKRMTLCMLLASLLLGMHAKGDEKPPLVVTQVQVSSGLQIPSDWLAEFSGRLVERLKYSQKFSQVFPPGDNGGTQPANTLRINLVGFKKGSRAMRYAVGFGAGQEKMKAAVELLAPDGSVRFSKNFSSTTTMGLFGGKSGDTPRKLAQKIVRALP